MLASVKTPKLLLPAVLACAANVAALSTSLMVRVPLVDWAKLLSVNTALLTPPITAASLVPVRVTVISWVVPSEDTAVKLSV